MKTSKIQQGFSESLVIEVMPEKLKISPEKLKPQLLLVFPNWQQDEQVN